MDPYRGDGYPVLEEQPSNANAGERDHEHAQHQHACPNDRRARRKARLCVSKPAISSASDKGKQAKAWQR